MDMLMFLNGTVPIAIVSPINVECYLLPITIIAIPFYYFRKLRNP